MFRTLSLLIVFLWNIVSFAQEKRSTFIKEQPLPKKVVNDFGKFLTKPEKDHLEKNLIAFRERKGYSVVIITLPGLTDNKGTEFTIEETAQLYFNRWGIGDNVKNDGVLIMLSKQPRRIRIHTGSGMGTLLTNANCISIINQTMVPGFKADLYFTGLKDAVKDIETHIDENEALNKSQSLAGSSPATESQPAYTSQGIAQPQEGMTFGKFMYGFITIVTLVWLFFRYRLKKAGVGRQGVYSGGGYESGGNVFNNVNRISNNNWGSGGGGGGRRRSWFNSGNSGNSNWFSGGGGYSSGSSSSSDSDSSSSSSSGSASGSYGGGKSSGGGASGSW
jgi:uncharacterized protein